MTLRPLVLAPLILLAVAAPPRAQEPAPRTALVRVPVGALPPAQLAEVLSGRYDVAARVGGALELVAGADDLRRLAERAIPHQVVTEDLTAFYAARLSAEPAGSTTLGAWLEPPFGAGSMGGFYTLSEVVSVLDQLAAAYPEIVAAKQSLGRSVQSRDLWAVEISDDPSTDQDEPEVRFDALHHAREPQSMQSTLWFMLYLVEGYGSDPLATWIVDERELWFVPVVNPDGYAYNQATAPGGGGLWRKNRRDNGDGTFGVDLNRNYAFQWGYDDVGSSPFTGFETYRGPFPASEPEIQAMQSFLGSRSFATALSVHTYSDLWLSPWGYDFLAPANGDDYLEVAALATQTSGYAFGPIAETLYLANGGTVDYDHGVHGTMSWTPEIGGDDDGFWPASDRIVPLAEETLLGFRRTALAAGAWVRVAGATPTDVGDGDGFFEAGEPVALDVEVRNSGMAATAGGVAVTLSTTSPWATVTDAEHSFGAVGSFAGASAAAAVALQLDAGAPAGAEVPWALDVACEGLVQRTEGELTVGVPRRFVHDDLELDFGWSAGAPGDTADTGLWERADPIGTSSSGEAASPEDDATPAPGTLCFTTGNGGGGAGTDDVDGGFTTLLTPILDLSSVTAAEVRYSRWWADLGIEDDVFRVSISNDGGDSWTALEELEQTENEWNQVGFRVDEHVAPTDEVRLRFVAADDPNNSVVEAAVDELEVWIHDDLPRLGLYGSAELGTPLAFHVTGEPGAFHTVLFALGTAQIPLDGVLGDLLLDPLTLASLFGGTIGPEGSAQAVLTVSGGPALAGTTVHFQALVAAGPELWLTNRAEATILP